MKVAIITGSGGLIGSEAVAFLSNKFDCVIGIDNNMREYFFGSNASTNWNVDRLKQQHKNYIHEDCDIRDYNALSELFEVYNKDISLIIHTAAQPSHDWACREPLTDFAINANGTLNMLELTRLHCPGSVFIFTSTNKVYGDNPNWLPLIEMETRYEVDAVHPYHKGIDERMSIDNCKHSVFGASKVAADIMVQEYGRYFGLKTGVFRGGCLTGPNHSGAQLHGFLSYLMKCCINKEPYTIFGYKGKQVRDNIHSKDLISAFYEYYKNPVPGEVYNIGGNRYSNCSILEAIEICEGITDNNLKVTYSAANRSGDHIWYISNTDKFKSHYPEWVQFHDTESILTDIFNNTK